MFLKFNLPTFDLSLIAVDWFIVFGKKSRVVCYQQKVADILIKICSCSNFLEFVLLLLEQMCPMNYCAICYIVDSIIPYSSYIYVMLQYSGCDGYALSRIFAL